MCRRVNRATAKYSDFTFPVDNYTDAVTLYDEISRRLPDLMDIGRTHTQVINSNPFFNFLKKRK